MTTTACRIPDCGTPTNGFICKPCLAELERAIGDWPSLLTEMENVATRQTRVYRANGRDLGEQDDLAQLDEEYAWRLAKIPSHLRSKIGRLTLPSTQAMTNSAARDLHDAAENMLGTWARHLEESGGVTLNLQPRQMLEGGKVAKHAPIEGPACAPHVHDFRTNGCGIDPESCKQLHPDHVHEMHTKGCAYRRDPNTGETLPCPIPHHCSHPSCELIRLGASATQAVMVTGWLLEHIDDWRWDEAGPEAHQQITAMHQRMTRAVDRSASRVYVGPCKAEVNGEHQLCEEPLYAWPWKRRDDGTIDPDDTVECDGYRPPFERHDPKKPPPPPPDPCGAVHTRTERVAWLIADVEDRLMPLSLWQQHLPPLLPELTWPHRTTWDRWGAGPLEVKARVEGVALYRGGDVITLCIREQKRIVGNRAKSGRIAS